MLQYFETLQDQSGNALSLDGTATVVVSAFPGGGAAPIYSTNGTASPIAASTVTADITGQISFYAPDADYILKYYLNGTLYKTKSPVMLFDGAAQVTFPDVGAVNAYAITNAALETSLRSGLRAYFNAANSNTGPSTFAYNTLAAKNLVQRGPIALPAGAVVASGIYPVEYDGTQWQLLEDTLTQPFYPISPSEQVFITGGGISPVAFQYPYGCPRRFGALGTGPHDDTIAVQAAINSNAIYWGWPGDVYGVTSVTWPASGLSEAHFNGSELVGIATTATPCISHIKSNFTDFYGYTVNGGSYAGVTPNSNYTCSSWWFNGVTSGTPVGASQFNNFYGMSHLSAVRGLVYGGLPGQSSSTTVHSENRIYGMNNVGVSNPMYVNSSTGFVHCYGCVFFRDASTWTTPTLPSTARSYEQVVGNLYINGGEIIASNSLLGNATDGSAIVTGVYIELACPLNITGNNARYNGCRINLPNQGVNMVTIGAAVTGVLAFNGCTFLRAAGNGATDRTPMVQSSSAGFEVELNDCASFEWGFLMAGANCKLIAGCVARYSNHRLQITDGSAGGDSNIYFINSPKASILPEANATASTAGQPAGACDHMGYTTNGWVLDVISGGGSTLTVTTNAGPTGYLASQLTCHATGQSLVFNGDPSTLTSLKASALRVRPGEAYWLSAWLNASGTNPALLAAYYTLAGVSVSNQLVADATSIGTGAWVFGEGPLIVPATAAYMLIGVQGVVTDVQFTDVRLQRAN
jgi:hypothetical protein